MSLFYDKYRIEPTRLFGYDYSRDGYYFVTICMVDCQCFFGRVVNGKMELNDIGRLACEFWKEIPAHCMISEIIFRVTQTTGGKTEITKQDY